MRLGRKEFYPHEVGRFIRNATPSYYGHDAVWGVGDENILWFEEDHRKLIRVPD